MSGGKLQVRNIKPHSKPPGNQQQQPIPYLYPTTPYNQKMEETTTSVFSEIFFARAIVVGGVLLWLTSMVVYPLLSSRYLHPVGAYIFAACFCTVDALFARAFVRSCKRITVSRDAVQVKNLISGKLIRIPYAEITALNTYRSQGRETTSTGQSRGRFGANFVIEYGNDQWLSFNESSFANYSELTMAIYVYKYGPGHVQASGHGRERYLARHGRG